MRVTTLHKRDHLSRALQFEIKTAIDKAMREGRRAYGANLFYLDKPEMRAGDKDGEYIEESDKLEANRLPSQYQIRKAMKTFDSVCFCLTGYYWENYDHKFKRNGWDEYAHPCDIMVVVELR